MVNSEANSAQVPAPPCKASTLKRVIQAAVLAAVVVPLGSVAIEADSVTCRFNNTGEGTYGGTYCNAQEGEDFFFATETTSRFDFGDYYLELEFLLDGEAAFDVTVNTFDMTQGDFLENRAGEFSEDYTCIALTDGGPCVEFEVVPAVQQEGNWLSYEIEIHWDKWVGQSYDPDLMRILHDIGGTEDGFYDDMCETALTDTSYLPCEIDPDPGIRSGDTDFQFFTAALATNPLSVPEPSSLMLLVAGVGSVLCRRRRRSEH